MKRVFIIIMVMAAALMALPAMAQSFGQAQQQPQAATFQSTSSFSGSGSSYSSNPALNENGTATYNAPSYAPGHPGHIRRDGSPWGDQTIVDHETLEGGSPIGDAVVPLLLMALAFCGVTYLRRRRV